MKIKINDLENILKQVREIENPASKEHHKILNTLKIFLEDNLDVQDGTLLKERQEVLQGSFSQLCKTRREKPKELSGEFAEVLKSVKDKIDLLQFTNKIDEFEIKSKKINSKEVLKDFKKLKRSLDLVGGRLDLIDANFKGTSPKRTNTNKTIIDYFRTL